MKVCGGRYFGRFFKFVLPHCKVLVQSVASVVKVYGNATF